MLLIGAAVFLGAGIYVARHSGNSRSPTDHGLESARILVAREILPIGTLIHTHHLKWADWPKTELPPGAFRSVDALLGGDAGQQRFVHRAFAVGEPIVSGKVSKLGQRPSMAQLRPGMRAVSIHIDSISGVFAFVVPGDRVDILLIRRLEGRLVSNLIVQDTEVLAIDQRSNGGEATPWHGRTITVAADTTQAQKLSLAGQVGRLSIMLGASAQLPNREFIDPLYDNRSEKPFPPVLRRFRDRISDFPIDPEIFPNYPDPFRRRDPKHPVQ
jgi:pilus assembly protein CpaB